MKDTVRAHQTVVVVSPLIFEKLFTQWDVSIQLVRCSYDELLDAGVPNFYLEVPWIILIAERPDLPQGTVTTVDSVLTLIMDEVPEKDVS